MNFFSLLNQVEQAAAVNNVNAKTKSIEIPAVEPQEEPEKPVKKKSVVKQKPAEGAGAENIEQNDAPDPEQTEGEE